MDAYEEQRMAIYEKNMADKEVCLKMKEAIRRHVDDVLKEHRFKYEESARHAGDARYVRKKAKGWQVIIFQTTTKSLMIRLQDRYAGEPVIRQFVPGVECRWSFGSLEEFERLCPEIVDALKRYVLRIFDLLPKELKGPNTWHEEAKALYENPKGLAADFKRLYGFPDDIFYTDIKRIEDMLVGRTDQSFEEAREFLLQASAYLGESFIKRFGGTWMVAGSGHLCFVGLGDLATAYEEHRYYNSFSRVFGAWEWPNRGSSSLYMSFLAAGKKSGTVPESWLSPFW